MTELLPGVAGVDVDIWEEFVLPGKIFLIFFLSDARLCCGLPLTGLTSISGREFDLSRRALYS